MATTGLLSDRYLIEKEIGRGGFGVVYLARDQRLLSKPVVVKVLEEGGGDPWLQKKFRQEIEALARIDHPGVVGVLDLGETPEGKPFLVMQFVEGVTLRSLIRSPGMEFGRVAGIMRQIGEALGAAHDKGVYHRDLKPENIMLEHAGEGGQHVRLIDFGIAAVRDSQVATGAQSSKVAGSFAYMAPEQLLGKASAASDIYALGVVAFEMLTGRRPELLPEGVKEMPAQLRPGLPEAAQAAILKALSFYPKDRHARPRDFTQELAEALSAPEEVGAASATSRSAPGPPPTAVAAASSQAAGLEMAYVLFMDLVGFSATTMDRQAHTIQLLQQIVRDTPEFQRALAADQLVSLPTGDGIALVFFHNPVAAVQCAVEVARTLKSHPELKLRLGVHAGPVYRIADINTNRNVTGGGINLAQRVMDCGDGGHILLSKSVAEVLSQLGDWAPQLHDLGEAQVKHGVKMHLVNLYTGEVGNPEIPEKLRKSRAAAPPKSHRTLYLVGGAGVAVVILVFAATQALNWRNTKAGVSPASLAPQAPTESLRPAASSPPPVAPPPGAPPSASGSASPAPSPATAQPASPPPAKPSRQAPAVVRDRAPASPPQATQQAPAQSTPAASPPPSQAPAPAAAPTPLPAKSDALAEQRERIIFLGARAGAVRSGLQNLALQQQASGLSLRGDMAAAQQRVDYLMGEANAALARRDADAAKRNLDLAERDVEKLERFLGR